MKALLLCYGLLLAGPLASQGQVPHPAATFFTADFEPTTSQDTLAFCAETVYRDSVSGVMKVYYPSGNLKQYIPYANVQRRLLYGTLSTWYEDGRMCTKEDYIAGRRDGELLTYYPDGTLRRREQYAAGRCGLGRCYAPDGTPVPYFIYEQLPLYPGGDTELIREITRAVRLNSQEMNAMRYESMQLQNVVRFGWQRKVDLELAVAMDGRVVNARVVHSTAGFLNDAALRAVAKLKRQFVPARRDGQVILSYLTVPITYTLQSVYNNSYGPSSPAVRRGRW